jgi:hypothetical protein
LALEEGVEEGFHFVFVPLSLRVLFAILAIARFGVCLALFGNSLPV